MEQQNGIKTWQWVVTVIVIIILVILGYNMFNGSPESIVNTDEEQTLLDTEKTSKDTNRVIVADQAPGNIVYISTVQLSKPGFVVIQKDNGGVPGDVIGSQYFDKGIFPGKITVTSPTIEGDMYYAVLYTDNGDKKFDIKKDLPIKDAKGNTIMKLFKVTLIPTELKG